MAEIEEKTIQILDKGQLEANKTKDTEVIEDNSILFNDADDAVNEKTNEEDTNNIMDVPFVIDDAGDADADVDDADDVGEGIDDVPDVDLLGGGHQLKKIVINPNYVAVDSNKLVDVSFFTFYYVSFFYVYFSVFVFLFVLVF